MSKLTPMMAQYKKVKAQHQDCILMFRLGDFYEMFLEDAVEASEILQIALTARNKGGSEKAPMCGVPYHAVEKYIAKLTRAGKKVALCDQVTKPDGKSIVKRKVVRVITPGTTFDESVLDHKANNYVGSITFNNGIYALAYADVTTGEFKVCELENVKDLEAELMRVGPAEIIGLKSFLESDQSIKLLFSKLNDIAVFPYEYFEEDEILIKNHFEINSLKVFGFEGKISAIKSAGMMLSYLKETQKNDLKHIQKIEHYEIFEFMPLDAACIRNLELFFNNQDGKKLGSLIGVLDETVCSMGGRLLKNWLRHPLIKKDQIENRLNKVDVFVQDSNLLRDLREYLKQVYDIERLLSRLSLGTGNARDLVALRCSLEQLPEIKQLIVEKSNLENCVKKINDFRDLKELIFNAIVDEAPATVREGGMIKEGFNTELDELRSISSEGKGFINDLQEREIKRTGISSLKVKYNKVFSYYIEVRKTNLAAIPDDYIRKQTLVNAERFITPELKEYEEKVLNAEDKIKELEYDLFYNVRMAVVKEIVSLQQTAQAIAELDVLANFAYIAMRNNYCKPIIVGDNVLNIKNGRHAVVEKMGLNRDFVPNDCVMSDERRFILITGPNMGGKSTYLRQVALIVLMAQIGCFVPAESAEIGLVDKIFTRVGASDNLSAGESTFMVEMQEAAYILNNASDRSLVILDEIGRGTSTYDGVSIAWAISEFMHDQIKAKTLFATHYHELVDLVKGLKSAVNMSSAVRENEQEGVVFLYKIVKGGVDKSYGIEVAKLAGLPREIVSRARGVLGDLEDIHLKNTKKDKQIGLFEEKDKRKHSGLEDEVKKMFAEVDVNEMTPIEGLQKLSEIKNKLKE
ncbi:DNA mismatch repair protein MutS [Patescibacteria group bacterium]